MELFVRPSKARGWWLKMLLVGLSLLLLGRSAVAQPAGPLFEVGVDAGGADPLVNYTTPIWATNFFNGANGLYSTFSYNLGSGSSSWLGALYNGWHGTFNFTNVGEMDSSTGFYFETQNASQTEAANFYNSGSINCGVSANAVFINQITVNGIIYGGYGGINVWATNVLMNNYGTVAVGLNGLAKFGGQNINFNNASVTIQGQSSIYSGASSANVSATGQTDNSTNGWTPADALNQFSAYGPMNSTPYELSLFDSVPYFKVEPDNSGTNFVVRMVFLQDNSVNVATNVYLFNNGFGNGTAYVEWVGTYTDPATGQPTTRYLYLANDYVQGSSTNILKYGDPGTGVPNNFTFLTSSTPLSLGAPATNGFVNGLLDSDTITNNIYSYVNAQLIPTSVATSGRTGTIAVTNLPGRVEITATNSLNLTQATVSGMNYLRLRSTNEFDYGQSQLAAPYSDFYLGHTNGSMVISNLVQAALPQWSGNVEAWTTRWFYTNATGNVYDFRALLVKSAVSPTSASQVQDFVLYSSNNVVISDQLNISRTFSLNCTNLLVTTNGAGNGATSLDGELNLGSTNIAWNLSLPRLRCLTNNGTITTLNGANYGSVVSPYLTLVNTGTITNNGNALVYAGDFENYGSISATAGSFSAQALTTTMTNASLLASGAVSLTAASLMISGTSIHAGGALTLNATNLLTDGGVTSSNFWSLGENYPGFGASQGLIMTSKPAAGDLLGTTITNRAAIGTVTINNTWAGLDMGYSNTGYNNNAAIGQLALDALTNNTHFYFAGTATDGTTNAIYVDCLQLLDFAGYNYHSGPNLSALNFNTNLVIYYAQAIDPLYGSVAEKINHWNNDHLRWVPSYAGYFSSTNIVYPDGTTNAVNAALAAATDIDSDRDGNNNASDPTPILVPSQLSFTLTLTNYPPLSAKLSWRTIPLAGNYIYYKTDLTASNWLPFTNFSNYYYGSGTAMPKTASNYFVSPQPYYDLPGPDNWETTNVWVIDPLTNVPHFYRISVQPN